MIKACAKAGDVARAEHWMFMVLKAGGKAGPINYSTVIKHVPKQVMWVDQSTGCPCF